MIRFWLKTGALLLALHRLGPATNAQIMAASQPIAQQMEAQAKRDAPWTDRTGNARRTLEGFVQFDGDESVSVGVCGNMPYSPKLELGYGGRYAVLVPTVDAAAPQLLNSIKQRIFDSILQK